MKEVTYEFIYPYAEMQKDAMRAQLKRRTVPVRTTPKIQNNEPCTCGSELKYKKCCKLKNRG